MVHYNDHEECEQCTIFNNRVNCVSEMYHNFSFNLLALVVVLRDYNFDH